MLFGVTERFAGRLEGLEANLAAAREHAAADWQFPDPAERARRQAEADAKYAEWDRQATTDVAIN